MSEKREIDKAIAHLMDWAGCGMSWGLKSLVALLTTFNGLKCRVSGA